MSALNLLTEAQAAEELHVCARTVRRLRQQGAIRYVAVTARTILYRREDLEAFVEQQAQMKHAPAARSKPKARKQGDTTVVSFTARRAHRRGNG